jgi:transposase-like protein
VQDRPAHPASLPAPLSRTVAPYAKPATRRKRERRRKPAAPEIFIPVTNAIESINFQLRKITRNRGHFPSDDAAIKLLYLGIRNITGRHIDGTGLTLQRGERGTGTYGWTRALNALAIRFGNRLPI